MNERKANYCIYIIILYAGACLGPHSPLAYYWWQANMWPGTEGLEGHLMASNSESDISFKEVLLKIRYVFLNISFCKSC